MPVKERNHSSITNAAPGERLHQPDSKQERAGTSVSAHGSTKLKQPIRQFLRRSGKGSSQEEVGVLFPAQHSVHFKGVG